MANILQKITQKLVPPVPEAEPVDALPPPPAIPGASAESADTARPARIGLWVLALGLGGFLLWAVFAPLDEGVPSQGVVAIDTKRKAVQHLTGGIVKEVLVGEGDIVREGQLLIRLDDATAKANFEAIRQRYLGLRAMQARLLAEQSGSPTINFHPDLVAASTDPLIKHQMVTQQQLFQSRRASLKAELQGIQESIEGQQALIQSYQGMLGSRRGQLALLQEELGHTRELVKEGYAPRNRQLELERMTAEANASLAELTGNTFRAQRSVAELRQKAIARQQEYRKEVESQLSDVTREVEGDETKYRALNDELGRMEIKSPATGQVVGLAVQTVGGVISGGQKVMDIVPEKEPLLLETRVPPHLIDRIHAGLPVDVRFNTFSNTPQLVVEGKLVSVSGDLLTDQQTGIQYYLARVTLTPGGMQKLGKRTLQPGMPVEVVLKTGERSLLAYLLHPLTKRMAAAMKEE
jgi:protease secretion system membrane fusion protein